MKNQNRNPKQHTNNFMKKFKKEELLPNIDPIADLQNEWERLERLKKENLALIRNLSNGNRAILRKMILINAKLINLQNK
jgi:hypothetical protein